MKKLIFSAIIGGLLAFAPVAGFAEDAKETGPDRVQIIEDDQSGIVRIVIDGKDVVLIDADGFHVNGNIDYSGTVTDKDLNSKPVAGGP